jgi:hypothetical protein
LLVCGSSLKIEKRLPNAILYSFVTDSFVMESSH